MHLTCVVEVDGLGDFADLGEGNGCAQYVIHKLRCLSKKDVILQAVGRDRVNHFIALALRYDPSLTLTSVATVT